MRHLWIFPLFFALALGAAGAAQEESSNKTAAPGYRVPEQLIESLEGRDLFRSYCAACHGENARGGGPAPCAQTTAVPRRASIPRRRAHKLHARRTALERAAASDARASHPPRRAWLAPR